MLSIVKCSLGLFLLLCSAAVNASEALMKLGEVPTSLLKNLTNEDVATVRDLAKEFRGRFQKESFNFRPDDIIPCLNELNRSENIPKIVIYGEFHKEDRALAVRRNLIQEAQDRGFVKPDVHVGLEGERPLDFSNIRKNVNVFGASPFQATSNFFGLEQEEAPQVLSLLRGVFEEASTLERFIEKLKVVDSSSGSTQVFPSRQDEVDRKFRILLGGFVSEASKYPAIGRALDDLSARLKNVFTDPIPRGPGAKDALVLCERLREAIRLKTILPGGSNLALDLFPSERGATALQIISHFLARAEARRIESQIRAGVLRGPVGFESYRYDYLFLNPTMDAFWDIDILWRDFSFAESIGKRVCSQLGKKSEIKVMVGLFHADHLKEILNKVSPKVTVEVRSSMSEGQKIFLAPSGRR